MTFQEATYDEEHDVLYIQFSQAEVERTVALDDLRLVDYDASKKPVGVEFMSASEGLDVSDVPFSDQIAAILARNGLDFAIFA
jgi:uncharacterized protein YuzE